MSGDAVIRPATIDEVEQILAIWRESEATPSLTDSRGEVLKLLGSPHAVLLVAEAGGRVAVINALAGRDVWSQATHGTGPVRCLVFDAKGGRVISGVFSTTTSCAPSTQIVR